MQKSVFGLVHKRKKKKKKETKKEENKRSKPSSFRFLNPMIDEP